jgi:hypothetical protein
MESNLIDLNDWEDFKDLLTSEILDEWEISSDLVSESIPGKVGNSVLEPVLHIRINQYFNNDEPLDIVKDCRNLHLRVYQMTGKFINVDWSSQQINIILDDIPNHWTILKDFNLQEVKSDNTIDNKSGGVCDYDTAIEIIEYLNKFYRFAYNSEINLFKTCFDIMKSKGDCKLVFSLPRFKDERFKQVVSFKLCYKEGWDENYPLYIIDTNYTDYPVLRLRYGGSWVQVSSGNSENKMINFLKKFISLAGY